MTKKIDIHYKGVYLCSTIQARTCKQAKAAFLESVKESKTHYYKHFSFILDEPTKLKANFDKTGD